MVIVCDSFVVSSTHRERFVELRSLTHGQISEVKESHAENEMEMKQNMSGKIRFS